MFLYRLIDEQDQHGFSIIRPNSRPADGTGMSSLHGVHAAAHNYVPEWPQLLQRLQSKTEELSKVQARHFELKEFISGESGS